MKTQHGRDLSGAELAEMVDEFCNSATKKDIEAFAEHVTCSVHRTIQQKIMGLFLATIEKWAVSQFDLRNEATVKMCQKIVAATGDKYDRCLPTH